MHVELRWEVVLVLYLYQQSTTSHVQMLQGKQLILLAACISQQELHDKGRCVLTISRLAVTSCVH